MNKKIKVSMLILTLGLLVTLASVDNVNAFYQGNNSDLVNKIATRFGVKVDDVDSVFVEHRQAMQADRQAQFETKLNTAVSSGKVTQEQKALILEHHTTMKSRQAELANLDPEARREAMQTIREENREWAQANGIDFLGEFGMGMRGGRYKGQR